MLSLLFALQAELGTLELGVFEDDRPAAARVHLADAQGKPVRIPDLPFWRDHVVMPGSASVSLPPGEYRLDVERGPETSAHAETLSIKAGATLKREVRLKRLVDLKSRGWWSGELHVHRAAEELPLHLEAEDLHVAPVITWWNKRNLWEGKEIPADLLRAHPGPRFTRLMAGEDERGGGALLFFGLAKPLAIADAGREWPSPVRFLREAKHHPGVHVDVEKPFWWDVPVWLATGLVDTIGIANNHMCRSTMYESEAWGRPRDAQRLPPPRGNGLWTQEIYYHLLNCGIRLPPSAGSASGVLANPVGYNRAYVRVDGELTYQKWFDGLRAGRSFVTNGPLLLARANGREPGAVFASEGPLEIDLETEVIGRDPAKAVEIVRDGRPEPLGRLRFEKSGWFLVRAIADVPHTFRFASTAPFYVEIGGVKSRVHGTSARFFVDWVEERIARIQEADPGRREEILRPHLEARRFWNDLLQRSDP